MINQCFANIYTTAIWVSNAKNIGNSMVVTFKLRQVKLSSIKIFSGKVGECLTGTSHLFLRGRRGPEPGVLWSPRKDLELKFKHL